MPLVEPPVLGAELGVDGDDAEEALAAALEDGALPGMVAKVVGMTEGAPPPYDGNAEELAPYDGYDVCCPGWGKNSPAVGDPAEMLPDAEERLSRPLAVVELDGAGKNSPGPPLEATAELELEGTPGKSPAPPVGATSDTESPVAVTVTYWTEVDVIVDVKTEQESSPESGAGAGEPAGRPAGGEPGGEPPAGATSVFDGTAIAAGTLGMSFPIFGEVDSNGMGLTVTVMTAVAVGRTGVASTDDGDSTGEPPKSVPLCSVVPLEMGKAVPVGSAQPFPVPVPWWKRLCLLWLG